MLAVITAALPTLFAAAALSTAVNQLVQRYLSASYPYLARVSNTITVDLVHFVSALADLFSAPSSKPRGYATLAPMIALTLVFGAACVWLGLLTGCGGSLQDPRLTAAERRAFLLCEAYHRADGGGDVGELCSKVEQLHPFLEAARTLDVVTEPDGDAGARD